MWCASIMVVAQLLLISWECSHGMHSIVSLVVPPSGVSALGDSIMFIMC